VGNVDGGRTGLDGDRDHLDQELVIGTGAVFSRELDVVGKGKGEANGFCGLLEGLLAGDAELVFEVQIGGGKEEVNAIAGRGRDGAASRLDVLALTAGERGDARSLDLAGDGLNGVKVALGGDGKSGFENIDA